LLLVAGLPLDKIAGSETSVFAGTSFRDYHDMLMKDMENLPRHFIDGNMLTMTANRISHFFDLRGPSVGVDTACSTALTALHLACQTLRTGEAKMAIVGAANLLLYPGTFIVLSNLG
jgi:acyl transferase domain-containing protein